MPTLGAGGKKGICMNKILFLIVLAGCSLFLNAQDILVLRGGGVYHVKVLEVTPTKVRYINNNDEKGTIVSVMHSNLYYIRYENGELQVFNDDSPEHVDDMSDYAEYMSEKGFSHEIDLYIQDGWGVGYQLRHGITSFWAMNIISISYMSGFTSPLEFGILNLRPVGFRFYTPIYEDIRLYTELNIGYSMSYINQKSTSIPDVGGINTSETFHFFGLGFTAGIQISKHFAVGYNLEFYKNNNGESIDHWGKISLIL